jgi:hypothetical protein
VAQSVIGGGVWGDAKPASGVTGWCSKIPQSGLVNCWPFDSTYTTSSTATDPIGGKNATLTNVTLNGSGPSTNRKHPPKAADSACLAANGALCGRRVFRD